MNHLLLLFSDFLCPWWFVAFNTNTWSDSYNRQKTRSSSWWSNVWLAVVGSWR